MYDSRLWEFRSKATHVYHRQRIHSKNHHISRCICTFANDCELLRKKLLPIISSHTTKLGCMCTQIIVFLHFAYHFSAVCLYMKGRTKTKVSKLKNEIRKVQSKTLRTVELLRLHSHMDVQSIWSFGNFLWRRNSRCVKQKRFR